MELLFIVSKEPFDLIDKGIKKEEYREIKPYWIKRILHHAYSDMTEKDVWYQGSYVPKWQFSTVAFKNGYKKDTKVIRFEFENIEVGKPNVELSAGIEFKEKVFIIKLGKRIS